MLRSIGVGKVLVLLLLLVMSVALSSCGEDGSSSGGSISSGSSDGGSSDGGSSDGGSSDGGSGGTTASVALIGSDETIAMFVNDNRSLTVMVKAARRINHSDIEWTSTNEGVVSVEGQRDDYSDNIGSLSSKATLQAWIEGNATIVATDTKTGESDSIKISVTEKPAIVLPVSRMEFAQTHYLGSSGKEYPFEAEIELFSSNDNVKPQPEAVRWSTSDVSVAYFDATGGSLVLKTLKDGSIVINASIKRDTGEIISNTALMQIGYDHQVGSFSDSPISISCNYNSKYSRWDYRFVAFYVSNGFHELIEMLNFDSYKGIVYEITKDNSAAYCATNDIHSGKYIFKVGFDTVTLDISVEKGN